MWAASNEVARRFGQNMRHVRKGTGLSQEALGFEAGLHRTEIGLLERGARVPRIDTLLKVAAGLGVKVESPLLDGMTWSSGTTTTTPGTFTFSAPEEEDASLRERRADTRRRAAEFREGQIETVDTAQLVRDGREKLEARTNRHLGGGWEASVYSQRDGRKLYKTFRRKSEARSWRAEAKRSLDRGKLRAPNGRTLRVVGEDWLDGAERGEIRNRSGRTFKPSTLRGYRFALEERVLPQLGSQQVTAIATADLQALVDRWLTEGHSPSTVRNWIKPLQAIYRRARAREGVPINPTRDLELPIPAPSEVEIVAPEIAASLLAVLPLCERAVWATALYAGLRYGELRALRWGAVDLDRRLIKVRESWDPKEGAIEPKTRNSRRTVPMPNALRTLLLDLRNENRGASPRVLAFGIAENEPFQAERLYRYADQRWREAGLTARLRLHQSRHTYASFMIAAGVNPKALSSFMGHASITVTFDLYGHLMPGTEAEGASLLDAYLGDHAGSDYSYSDHVYYFVHS